MLVEIALTSAFLFGHGDWVCDSESVYDDGMREILRSHVITQKDLTYNEVILVKYHKVNAEDIQSQLQVKTQGYKKVDGMHFKAYPVTVEVKVDFDDLKILISDFIERTKRYYQYEESLKIEVLSIAEHKMLLKDADNNKT